MQRVWTTSWPWWFGASRMDPWTHENRPNHPRSEPRVTLINMELNADRYHPCWETDLLLGLWYQGPNRYVDEACQELEKLPHDVEMVSYTRIEELIATKQQEQSSILMSQEKVLSLEHLKEGDGVWFQMFTVILVSVCVGAGFGVCVWVLVSGVRGCFRALHWTPSPPPPPVGTPPVNSLQETPAAPPSLAAEARQDGPRTPNVHFFKRSLALHTPSKNSTKRHPERKTPWNFGQQEEKSATGWHAWPPDRPPPWKNEKNAKNTQTNQPVKTLVFELAKVDFGQPQTLKPQTLVSFAMRCLAKSGPPTLASSVFFLLFCLFFFLLCFFSVFLFFLFLFFSLYCFSLFLSVLGCRFVLFLWTVHRTAHVSHTQICLVRGSVCLMHFLSVSPYSPSISLAMFRTLLDPPFTGPTRGTSTSPALLFPSTWTPSTAPLFGRFREQSPLTGYEPNAPIEVSSAATPFVPLSRICLLESNADYLATTLDASGAGDRSDVGRLTSPLFLQARGKCSPFIASLSHSRSSIEKSMTRNHNRRKSSRNSGSVQGSQTEREKILSEQRDLHNFFERKADQAFRECAIQTKVVWSAVWFGQRNEDAEC